MEHLFRREYGRLVSGLVRHFGLGSLALAEDLVGDVLVRALESWKLRGVPENPSAWLAAAARHRALDHLRRERTARSRESALGALAREAPPRRPDLEVALEGEMPDAQLRMMFTCCHPGLPKPAQVGLVLHVLAGFGTREVAHAFLESAPAVEKRLQRAKRFLAATGALFDVGGAEIGERLEAVLEALYLVFSEGYHGSHPEATVREDLCEEATRLTHLLAGHPATARPETFALLALMCLGAARLPARLDLAGDLQPLAEQDRSRWDRALAARGLGWLERAAEGERLCAYHLEAAIAAEHAVAPGTEATRWDRVLSLYDLLLRLRPTPVVALNRAIALGMVRGPERGIAALEAIDGRERLGRHPFYEAALGEFHARAGRRADASAHFRAALGRARGRAERRFLERRLAETADPAVRH